MISILEMANYCRQIYDYAVLNCILHAATLQSAPHATQWTKDMHKDFLDLKHVLTEHHQLFHLHVHEQDGSAILRAS